MQAAATLYHGGRQYRIQAAATLYYGDRQYRIQAAATLYYGGRQYRIQAAASLEIGSHVCYNSRDKHLTQIARYHARVTMIPCNLSKFLQEPSKKYSQKDKIL